MHGPWPHWATPVLGQSAGANQEMQAPPRAARGQQDVFLGTSLGWPRPLGCSSQARGQLWIVSPAGIRMHVSPQGYEGHESLPGEPFLRG
mmetsp:Transcript_51011/g.95495  ORF Transcript_51011/g.95495 Transcript_51011/m.95495 type:complete len:90 (+) Transcript_51011:344-613(+)